MALERDGCFDQAADPYMMAGRVPKENEMMPSIIYHDHPLIAGTEFLPDDFIVKVILFTKNGASFFRHDKFPSNLLNSPSSVVDREIKSHMRLYSKEGYHTKLSDFHLLLNLAKRTDHKLVLECCRYIADKTAMPVNLCNKLDEMFLAKQYFEFN